MATDDRAIGRRPVVLFDFDGTIVDTARGIIQTIRTVMGRRGLRPEDMGDLRCMIGPPLVDGFRDTFGLTRAEAEQATAEYREEYFKLGPEFYPVIDGMREVLDDLVADGRRLALATSRREDRACFMAAQQGLDQFEAIRGLNEPVRYTKADSIRDALAALGVTADDAVMVGDRFHDVEGAHALGVPAIGLYTGTASPGEHERAGAEVICHSIEELRRALGIDHPSR